MAIIQLFQKKPLQECELVQIQDNVRYHCRNSQNQSPEMYNLNTDNGASVLVPRIMGFVGSKRKFKLFLEKDERSGFFSIIHVTCLRYRVFTDISN